MAVLGLAVSGSRPVSSLSLKSLEMWQIQLNSSVIYDTERFMREGFCRILVDIGGVESSRFSLFTWLIFGAQQHVDQRLQPEDSEWDKQYSGEYSIWCIFEHIPSTSRVCFRCSKLACKYERAVELGRSPIKS